MLKPLLGRMASHDGVWFAPLSAIDEVWTDN